MIIITVMSVKDVMSSMVSSWSTDESTGRWWNKYGDVVAGVATAGIACGSVAIAARGTLLAYRAYAAGKPGGKGAIGEAPSASFASEPATEDAAEDSSSPARPPADQEDAEEASPKPPLPPSEAPRIASKVVKIWMREEGDLAPRSKLATKPALSYLDVFLEALDSQWSRRNPNGYVPLLIAENKLSADVIAKRVRKEARSVIPESALGYGSFRGSPEFRAAVASYASRTFARGCTLAPEDLCISAGCGAVIDNVCFAVCSAGDRILIPAPYYPAFDNDLRVRAGVQPTPVHATGGVGDVVGGALPSDADLERAFAAEGGPARVLLLTNPHNPMGVVVPFAEVVRCVRWALGKGMHVISDEIYANSVYDPAGKAFRFTSVASMLEAGTGLKALREQERERVHVIFGFSKDLCASGLRVGCLYTKNDALLRAMDNLGYFGAVSGHTALLLQRMLEDASFVDTFLKTNAKRLKESYAVVRAALGRMAVPFVEANAGMFVWIDLSAYLEAPTFEAERTLWNALAKEARVLFTPGEDCHAKRPGRFRVCFAWTSKEALAVGMKRLEIFLNKRKAIMAG